jgi:hypothetical protein
MIGRMEMDRTFEERDDINRGVVLALNEASTNWGVKVLRYEIKDLTSPKEILHAMQRQITAEREKRALIASSEGRMQEQINIATGARNAAIQESEGEMQAAINVAQGEAEAIKAIAAANAEAIAHVARCRTARRHAGGEPQGCRKIRRSLRRHRQGRQHPDRAVQHGGHQHPDRGGDERGEVAERNGAGLRDVRGNPWAPFCGPHWRCL